MNRRMIGFLLGKVFLVEAGLMLLPILVGLIYREADTACFVPPVILLAGIGALLGRKRPADTVIFAREGLFVVAASWILLSVFGAIPFYLSGSFENAVDCFFEIVSGFTTTGASVLAAPEELSHCMLFWRSFSHWIGGMGVLVFMLAVMPLSDNRSLYIMRAEVPGPAVDKLVPRMRDTATILYRTYGVLTALLVILLLVGKMPLFDALCTAFGTAGTGGFSVHSAGLNLYNSAYIEIVVTVFMLLFGVNFNLFYLIWMRRAGEALRNEELHVYLGIVITAGLIIAGNIYQTVGSVGSALRLSFFQVSSIITTTGFATADYATYWPQFSQHILVMLMAVGACAGSTGGGFKISRVILLIKASLYELNRMIHPRAVSVVRLDKKPVDKEMIHGIKSYLGIYVIVLVLSTLLLSLDGYDFATNFTAELSCLNNIGPGIGLVGPAENFSIYSPLCTLLLALNMLLGRLEIFPILVLFSPGLFRKRV